MHVRWHLKLKMVNAHKELLEALRAMCLAFTQPSESDVPSLLDKSLAAIRNAEGD